MAVGLSRKILVMANVVWIDAYQGDAGTIRNVGHRFAQASHEAENSGELFNFLPIQGRCYGYVPRFTPSREFKKMNLTRLGAQVGARELSDVTVVWTATPAPRHSRVVVGWYESATAYEKPVSGLDPNRPDLGFYFCAPAERCFLVPAELRDHEIDHVHKSEFGDGPGNDAFYYPSRRITALLDDYMSRTPVQPVGGPATTRQPVARAPGTRPRVRTPRQPDIEMRQAIEKAAMDEVKRVLGEGDWKHDDVSAKYTGWDITATKDGLRSLRVEVKGLSGSLATVELTPNEYLKLGYDVEHPKQDRYVVAIVTNTLDDQNRQLQCFSIKGKKWLPFDLVTGVHLARNGVELTVTPVTGAVCSVVMLPPT